MAINGDVFIEILDNFSIPIIVNSFGNNEVILPNDNAFVSLQNIFKF